MTAKEKYLEKLNVLIEKYLVARSMSSFLKLKAFIKTGEKKFKLHIGEYHYEMYNSADFDKGLSKDVSRIRYTYKMFCKTIKSYERGWEIENDRLANELHRITIHLIDRLSEKCHYKFKTGKYIIIKNNTIFYQIDRLMRDSYQKITKPKQIKHRKIKKDKFAKVRLFVKEFIRKNKDYGALGI